MAIIVGGMPPHEFYDRAWESEPLTKALEETDIPFVLPMPNEEMSLVAKNESGEVVGQCSANPVTKYWTHVERLDAAEKNLSTQTFLKIHQKAVVLERGYLKQNGLSEEMAWHNAGVAVLPEHRGKNIGRTMMGRQIESGLQHFMSVLFYEATSRHSAAIAEKSGLIKLAEFKYSDLAMELQDARLSSIHDSFSIWCLRGGSYDI